MNVMNLMILRGEQEVLGQQDSARLSNLCNHNMSGCKLVATNDNAGVLYARQGGVRQQTAIYGHALHGRRLFYPDSSSLVAHSSFLESGENNLCYDYIGCLTGHYERRV